MVIKKTPCIFYFVGPVKQCLPARRPTTRYRYKNHKAQFLIMATEVSGQTHGSGAKLSAEAAHGGSRGRELGPPQFSPERKCSDRRFRC